jgi:hypothetical protein
MEGKRMLVMFAPRAVQKKKSSELGRLIREEKPAEPEAKAEEKPAEGGE